MKKLELIKQQEVLGQDFRVYGTVEEPLFLAKDVAEWLGYNRDDYGYANTAQLVRNVDPDEKVKIYCTLPTVYNVHSPLDMGVTEGATNRMFLTEDGLYEVLMLSRKPVAKQFKKQVKAILKDIRKHGAYLTDSKIEEVLTDPDTLIKLATQLKEERAEKARLLAEAEESKPKLEYHDNVLQSETGILTTVIAKELGMSAVKLNRELHNRGIQYKAAGTWVLYSKYEDKGYTDTKTTLFTDSFGNTHSNIQRVWTEKGRQFIHDIMSRDVTPTVEAKNVFDSFEEEDSWSF